MNNAPTLLRHGRRHPLRTAMIAREAVIAADNQDLKLFALAFTAFFTVIWTFIS